MLTSPRVCLTKMLIRDGRAVSDRVSPCPYIVIDSILEFILARFESQLQSRTHPNAIFKIPAQTQVQS